MHMTVACVTSKSQNYVRQIVDLNILFHLTWKGIGQSKDDNVIALSHIMVKHVLR